MPFLFRLWAEVFHVSTSSAGTVRWQQISEDLVPVNISCIQDQPDYVFHITAYNSQVDKILDVRLTQPGLRLSLLLLLMSPINMHKMKDLLDVLFFLLLLFKTVAFSDIELFVAVAPLNQPDMQRCV